MRVWRLAMLGGVALATACSSGGGASDGGDGGCVRPLASDPMDPLAACLALANAEAQHEIACKRLPSAHLDDFVAAQCPEVVFGPREQAFDAGTFAYSTSAVNAAVAYLAFLACNQGTPGSVTSAFSLSPDGHQLGWGIACEGAICDDVLSCGTGDYCQRTDLATGCGVCAANPSESDLCGSASVGLICNDGACNGEECVALLGAGGSCGFSEGVCVAPLICGDEGETCVSAEAPPTDCGTDAQCVDSVDGGDAGTIYVTCITGGADGICNPAPGDGGSCALQNCAPGLICGIFDGGAGDGGWDECEPFDLVNGGGPCQTEFTGSGCPEFESCRDGGCFELSLLDGGCGVDLDCAVGGCLNGSCQLKQYQQECSSDSECTVQRCDTQESFTCGASCTAP